MLNIARMFVGGFLTAVILVGTMAGFTVVDLSTDRYMPGKTGPMMALTSVGNDGVDLSFMGKYYHFGTDPANSMLELASEYQGLIPTPVKSAAAIAATLANLFNERVGD